MGGFIARYRNFRGIPTPSLDLRQGFQPLVVYYKSQAEEGHALLLRFICRHYGERDAGVSISNSLLQSPRARRGQMLDLAMVIGAVLVCGFIAYERLCNKL